LLLSEPTKAQAGQYFLPQVYVRLAEAQKVKQLLVGFFPSEKLTIPLGKVLVKHMEITHKDAVDAFDGVGEEGTVFFKLPQPIVAN